MSENVSRNDVPKERDSADRKREEAMDRVFEAGMALLETDKRIFSHFEQLLGAVVGKVKEDPNVVFTGRSDNISDLVSALKAVKSEGGGVKGGDIVGGAGPSLSEIGDFIRAIGDHAKDEKKLLAQLIFAVICNCECVCKCMCE